MSSSDSGWLSPTFVVDGSSFTEVGFELCSSVTIPEKETFEIKYLAAGSKMNTKPLNRCNYA